MQSNCEAVDHYAANNPVRYTDPDGRQDSIPFSLKFCWLPAADGLLPIGDAIFLALVSIDLLLLIINNKLTISIDDFYSTPNNTGRQTQLFRAVGQAELDSILATGQFSIGDGSSYEYGKMFATNPIEAFEYAKAANKNIAKDNPYVAVVFTTTDKKNCIPASTLDVPSAVIVPENKLPLLVPNAIMPLEN